MRVSTNRPTRAALVGLVLLIAPGGCGYAIRPPFDRTIKTVYVPIFKSQSFRKDLHLLLTEKLMKEIQRRTPYTIVNSPEEADAVLEGEINYFDKNMVVESPNNLPRHLMALITAQVKFYDNRPGAPERPLQSVYVMEQGSFYPELGETSLLGFEKAIDKTVSQIVGMMEERW